MDIPITDRIKHRLIPFSELHPDKNQARTAALGLAELAGVVSVEPLSANTLKISYDVLEMTFIDIEEILGAMGLHIDRNLLYRLRSAVYHYTEETLRANCGCPRGESNCTKKIFAQRFESRDHTCRDHKPEHWRRYL
jgi:hypothetical protein